MRITLSLFLVLLVTSLSAQTGFDRKNYDSYFDLKNYLTKSSEDQTEINFTCAIFILPTEAQLERMEAEYGEDFEVITADQDYYIELAADLLDEVHIRTIQMKSGMIRFAGYDGKTWTLDTNKDGAPSWNLIFFEINKPPLITSIVDLTENAVDAYFEVEE